MRAVLNTNAAMPANDWRGIFSCKVNGIYNTGFFTFSAAYAFFFVKQNAAAVSVGQGARRAGADTGAFLFAGKTMVCKKFPGKAAQGTHLDCAFGIRIAFVDYSRTNALACKAADTFIHIV
jgi:hypothetical protein